jgi:hypothetical protein
LACDPDLATLGRACAVIGVIHLDAVCGPGELDKESLGCRFLGNLPNEHSGDGSGYRDRDQVIAGKS